MIERAIKTQLLRLAGYFPVVTILGPRQSGKTTLAKNCFPQYSYVNLDDQAARQLAFDDPNAFFKTYPTPLIIDEVQRVPQLLNAVQLLADAQDKNGIFILTGSHQPQLHAEISQSLAGRTGILKLLPLSIAELSAAEITLERDEYILNGFMPRLYDKHIPPDLLYGNYYSTYVERDVRQLVNIANLRSFELFVKLLAGRVGQIVSLNSMAGDVGVSATTLNSWLSVLEASYIVFRLPGYFSNFGKRQIKSSKVYFSDVGLAAYLLGIENTTQVARDPLFGGLFENMVVLEALKARYNRGKSPELYYFRDKQGLEIDLILNQGRQIIPIEIKSAMTYDLSFAKNLQKFNSFASNVISPAVIYGGELETEIQGVKFVNFRNIAGLIDNMGNL
ncbi:MAG: ATP-binding protein [Victivallales bacterium]|jgi:predicted AAA+ superfamily ATPase|nr:ATP-binding protein [Victivallales bacterium]